jgi:hypothetical protein
MTTPTQCQALESEKEDLTARIESLNQHVLQGRDDPHPGKPDPEVLSEKRGLVHELGLVDKKLQACMVNAGGKPTSNALFAAVVTLTIQHSDPRIQGPFHRSTTIALIFWEWDHSTVGVTNFPIISAGPFDVPTGTDTILVSMTTWGSGTFDSSTGALTLDLPLHFHHTFWAAGDSDITFHLSTGAPQGSALDAAGQVTVAGTATFQGGYLGGHAATVVARGTISPLP